MERPNGPVFKANGEINRIEFGLYKVKEAVMDKYFGPA